MVLNEWIDRTTSRHLKCSRCLICNLVHLSGMCIENIYSPSRNCSCQVKCNYRQNRYISTQLLNIYLKVRGSCNSCPSLSQKTAFLCTSKKQKLGENCQLPGWMLKVSSTHTQPLTKDWETYWCCLRKSLCGH